MLKLSSQHLDQIISCLLVVTCKPIYAVCLVLFLFADLFREYIRT